MATAGPRRLVTDRDIDVLTALDRCPLTVEQLLKLSRTFQSPFGHPRRLRRRLQLLADAGRVNRWQYATVGSGSSPGYYTLTPLGYRLVYGETAALPARRHFSEVGLSHQFHTRSLADFIVHTIVAAHPHGIRMANFYRENTLRLSMGEETLYPDCAFELVTPDGRQFNFVVEIDNGTERVRSQKDIDSWERKIRLYDACQDRSQGRFRVLVVATRSGGRLVHILTAAAELVRNPRRSLFYGIHLTRYLNEPDAVRKACFQDHRGAPVSLVPSPPPGQLAAPVRDQTFAPAAAV